MLETGNGTPNAGAQINVTPSGAGTPPPAAASGTPAWYDSFDPDTKGYVQNKGFKDPAAVVESYRNMEKLLGKKETLLSLPEKADAPEWRQVYERLGMPKEAKEYAIEGELADWGKETFHKLGLTKDQGEKLYKEWNAKQEAAKNAATESYNLKLDEEVKGLEKEWGSAYQQNLTIAKRAVARFGIDGETVDKMEQAMGHGGLMKFLHNLGTGLGEDKFVTSQQNGGFVLTPEAAQNKIKTLMSDSSFVTKLTSGDLSAREEWDRLNKMAVS